MHGSLEKSPGMVKISLANVERICQDGKSGRRTDMNTATNDDTFIEWLLSQPDTPYTPPRRYILLDEHSGYVWGDCYATDPCDACRKIDEDCGEHGREYTDIGSEPFAGRSGYHVHEAPHDFLPMGDGQFPKYIDEVAALPFVTRVATRTAE
jgi:hypothetical protein